MPGNTPPVRTTLKISSKIQTAEKVAPTMFSISNIDQPCGWWNTLQLLVSICLLLYDHKEKQVDWEEKLQDGVQNPIPAVAEIDFKYMMN